MDHAFYSQCQIIPVWYPTVSIPSQMVTHSLQPFLRSARMYLTSAFLWLLDISTICQWQDNDFPQKTILRQPIGSVLSTRFPPSVNDKWQPQVDGNKSFFKIKLIPEEETYIHIHTQNPEKHWKLKNNHFRRQKKKPEHVKQIMAPWTKPPSFPEGNFTIQYDKWSQKTSYGKPQGIQAWG